ncbi:putative sodium-coupled neutral amino acid transporter 10 isoform X2 [Ruditapes philippinarum]|uniref:putative sodium-coupled neutral amino acid transporter 10 isoform X2 n=1 Tax=Ruditapes philippinarum TaxID=129788 RepID=UPI00295ADE33|nr:putative sodium-coupled neutral amino acid transporter 10 isoform X2 [Ruditapes philippinarum]
MSQNNWPFVINVGNSIIGVTILAMPFCFQACGIILGTLLLLFATWLTIVSCQLLMKAGVTSRRRSYSLLAFFTHGALGKLIVEIGMIGLQLGTLIAQVVIIGDLGPAIVSKATGLQNSDNLRTGIIVVLCLFVGLPLGLLKDVRTLSKTSTLCILFYAFFTCYIVALSVPNLIIGDWYNKVNFWRMEGFFQCLPIFSFAFGCQTQLFIVYDALADPSLKRINGIVGSAVNMCTVSYLLVGFFGYIAFCNAGDLSGDIINHFRQNSACDAIKLLFVFSIAVTIPLIVFPCRASLYTLCFPHAHKTREDVPGGGKIPELHFKIITIIIIVGSMIIGILIPNIEFVLGINGATMGTLICYIFPALFFLSVMSDKAEGLFTGKVVLAFGLTIMIASTYTILTKESTEVRVDPLDIGDQNPVIDISKIENSKKFIDNLNGEMAVAGNGSKTQDKPEGVQERQEPPIPQEPVDDIEKVKKETVDISIKKSENEVKDKVDTEKHKETVDKKEDNKPKESDKGADVDVDKKEEEDKEKQEEKMKEAEKKQDEILAKLEQQQEQQEKLIQEQKEILEQLKEHKDSHKDDEVANPQKQLNQDQGGQVIQGNADIQNQKVDVQIPVQNQQGGALNIQQNIPGGVHNLQQNVQGAVQNLQQNAQGYVQNNQPNVQGGGQNLQPNVQGVGQNIQPNVQGVGQNGQLNSQGNAQNFQQAGQNIQNVAVQNPQQNLQGQNLQQNVLGVGQNIQNVAVQNPQQNVLNGGQNIQQNVLGDQNLQQNVPGGQNLQQNVQGGQNLQQNVQGGQNLQQNVQGGQNLQQNAQGGQDQQNLVNNAQIYQQQNQQQFDKGQQIQVQDKQVHNNPMLGNLHNLQQNAINGDKIDDNIQLKHRGKRESDVLENNVVNAQQEGIVSNNGVDTANQGGVNTQIDSQDKVNADVAADNNNKLDEDGETDVSNKGNNGQRDLKQVHSYVEKAQYGSDGYINEVLNGLKYKHINDVGKEVVDRIDVFRKVNRR